MLAKPTLWTFAEIMAHEPARAKLLESAPDSDAIRSSVMSRLEAALMGGNVRVGMEQADSNPSDLRAVLQFPIGGVLFDQFFNANTGYRAQFRRDWQVGFEYNHGIITIAKSLIASLLPAEVLARNLSPKFEDCGEIAVTRERICLSLNPNLSKLWCCGLLINGEGLMVQLPSGATGPRLRLDEQTTWAALVREEQDAWLDIKGAFLGSDGPYQPKDPVGRAKKLQLSGEA